jgi:hypothetical protein
MGWDSRYRCRPLLLVQSGRFGLLRQPDGFEGLAVWLTTRSPDDARKHSSISRSKRWPPIRQENNLALRSRTEISH